MSDHVDDEEATIRRYGLHIGVVTDNADELGVGRVKARIPGLYEPDGPWMWPLGTLGGGGGPKPQGAHVVPQVGAEVAIWFNQGDVDDPRYMPAHYGAPDGQPNETPTPIQTLSATDAVSVAAFQFGRYIVVIDNRDGQEGLMIQDTVSEDRIQHDGVKGSWVMKGTSAVIIQADGSISIDAPIITIGGRPVGPGPEQV